MDAALSHDPVDQDATPEAPDTYRAQAPAPTELLTARRDWVLARVALMLIDAAKLLDPITRIVINRVLALGALAAGTGLAVYTVSRTASWERVAVCAVFLVLCAWLVRKGQQ